MERFKFKSFLSRKAKAEAEAESGFRERRSRKRIPLKSEITVLIVDDSKTVVHVLKTILEQAGYNTVEAYNGQQGIDFAIFHQPELILMDVVMPGITGFQATRALSRDPRTEHIPIVMISGSEQVTEKAWCLRLGACDFLAKPIERATLFTCIEDHLNPALLANA